MTAKSLLAALLLASLPLSAARAQDKYPQTLTVYTVFGTPIDFVLVPQGTFLMGAQNDDKNLPNYNPEYPSYYSNQGPVHEVTLPAFYIAKYEVTKQVWSEIMGGDVASDDYDVAQGYVSYDNAQDFLAIAALEFSGIPEGATLSLPSEEQWECAAHGGPNATVNYVYAGSNDPGEVAVYLLNSTTPIKVGTKNPNTLGIYDMSGNVYEWTTGDYRSYDDGSLLNKNYDVRVLRGGYIGSRYQGLVTIYTRGYDRLSTAYEYYGFRLAINLPAEDTSTLPANALSSTTSAPSLTVRDGVLLISMPDGSVLDVSGRQLIR